MGLARSRAVTLGGETADVIVREVTPTAVSYTHLTAHRVMNGVGGGWNERHPGELTRLARPTDADRQRTVERAAGARFLTVDMTAVAAEEPMSAETLAAYARSGRSWVATRCV